MVRVAFLACIVIAVAGCGVLCEQVKGAGAIKTETRNVADFTRIELAGSLDVVYAAGPKSVTVSAQPNILDLISTQVKSGKLVIDSRKGFSTSEAVTVKISSPRLSAFVISGSGSAKISNLKESSFDAVVTGSGSIACSGEVRYLNAKLSGSGEIVARNLKASNCKADVTGSGAISLGSLSALDASISGSGSIGYKSATTIRKSITGSGQIAQQ